MGAGAEWVIAIGDQDFPTMTRTAQGAEDLRME
jgi:hypothetical protein